MGGMTKIPPGVVSGWLQDESGLVWAWGYLFQCRIVAWRWRGVAWHGVGRKRDATGRAMSNLPIQRPVSPLLWCPLVFSAGQQVKQGQWIRPEGQTVQEEGQPADGW